MESKMLVCAVIVAVLASGVGNLNGGKQPAAAPNEAAQPKADGDELAKLGKARLEAAEKTYKEWSEHERRSRLHDGILYRLSVQWLNAGLDLAKNKDKRTAAYSAHLERMKAWEERWKNRFEDRPGHPY